MAVYKANGVYTPTNTPFIIPLGKQIFKMIDNTLHISIQVPNAASTLNGKVFSTYILEDQVVPVADIVPVKDTPFEKFLNTSCVEAKDTRVVFKAFGEYDASLSLPRVSWHDIFTPYNPYKIYEELPKELQTILQPVIKQYVSNMKDAVNRIDFLSIQEDISYPYTRGLYYMDRILEAFDKVETACSQYKTAFANAKLNIDNLADSGTVSSADKEAVGVIYTLSAKYMNNQVKQINKYKSGVVHIYELALIPNASRVKELAYR